MPSFPPWLLSAGWRLVSGAEPPAFHTAISLLCGGGGSWTPNSWWPAPQKLNTQLSGECGASVLSIFVLNVPPAEHKDDWSLISATVMQPKLNFYLQCNKNLNNWNVLDSLPNVVSQQHTLISAKFNNTLVGTRKKILTRLKSVLLGMVTEQELDWSLY